MGETDGQIWRDDPGGLLFALLNTDAHAVFLVEPSLRVRAANHHACAMQAAKTLVRLVGDRLAGRTNLISFELARRVQGLLSAPDACLAAAFPAPGKAQYTFELLKLDRPADPLVLIRVYDGFAAPEASGATALALPERPLNPIARRLSADRKHGPISPRRRDPLPPLAPLVSFEAYARLGSMSAAALELGAFVKTISRHVHDLEGLTRRTLIEGERHRVRLTPAGRQVARALTEAFDTLEAAVRPLPPGKRRGRAPTSAALPPHEYEPAGETVPASPSDPSGAAGKPPLEV